MNNTYYDKDAISQSKIKKFIESKSEFKLIYIDKLKTQKDTDNLKFGKLCHHYNYQYNTIKDHYIVIPDSDVVGSMMGDFIELVAKGLNFTPAYNLAGFKQSYETTIKQFEKPENQKYYNLLLEAQGKTVVSELDRHIAKKMKEVYIRDNEFLARAKADDWMIFPEQEIYFKSNFSDLDLKMMADCIYIKPDFSEVVIEDLKTTEDLNLNEFTKSIRKYRYDIQQSFYKLGVINWIEQKFNQIISYDNIKFVFVPQRKQYPYEILDFIEIDSLSEDKAYNDWTQALLQIKQCLLFNDWSKDKSEYVDGRKLVKIW